MRQIIRCLISQIHRAYSGPFCTLLPLGSPKTYLPATVWPAACGSGQCIRIHYISLFLICHIDSFHFTNTALSVSIYKNISIKITFLQLSTHSKKGCRFPAQSFLSTIFTQSACLLFFLLGDPVKPHPLAPTQLVRSFRAVQKVLPSLCCSSSASEKAVPRTQYRLRHAGPKSSRHAAPQFFSP